MALSRGIPSEMLEQISSGNFYPVTMVEIEWTDGNTYYFHTGFGELEWGGQTWLPTSYLVDGKVAQIGSISIPEENLSIAAADADLKIVSTIESLLATQAEYGKGLEASFYFGVVTEPSGNVLHGDAIKMFTGITGGNYLSKDDPELGLSIVSGVPARASAAIVHSTEDQQTRYPHDTIFDRLGVAQKWKDKGLPWPE